MRKVVGIVAANPALSSLLLAILVEERTFRVRTFEGGPAVAAYMALVPVDVVIADLDCPFVPAIELARRLRADPRIEKRDFRMIGMTRRTSSDLAELAEEAGLDEVLTKPVSPLILTDRVLIQANAPSRNGARFSLRRTPRFGGNVVELFPSGLTPAD